MSIEEAPTAAAEESAAPDTAPDTPTNVEGLPAGSIVHTLVEKMRRLPPDKQQEVLDFVEFLQHKAAPKRPLQSPEGLWAGLGVHITAEDIAEARREMWGNFPREDMG